jgi:hypothetical protein
MQAEVQAQSNHQLYWRTVIVSEQREVCLIRFIDATWSAFSSYYYPDDKIRSRDSICFKSNILNIIQT